MTRRPQADLDSLTVPKEGGEVPAAAPVSGKMQGYAHTLSLRLSAEQYRRLRRYVTEAEDRTGQRVSHQSVIESALAEWLDRHGG
jgi:hypothetical protein